MNEDVVFTLEDAVGEVLSLLTGSDLEYQPELDRFQAVTRQLNRALRAVALDHEWSFYSSLEDLGGAPVGSKSIPFRGTRRPRIINDDAVRLVKPGHDHTPVEWAYFLPRDALHKYAHQNGLWCAVTRQSLDFSRPFRRSEAGLHVMMPVMREPAMFRLPKQPHDPNEPTVTVDREILEQPLDFDYPDLVIRRAAYYYAQTDPIMQPRVPTLEDDYKQSMYALIERDTYHTDTPYMNEWDMGISGDISGNRPHGYHPHADFGAW